jgi:transposase
MDATPLAADADLPGDVGPLQAMVRELRAEVVRLRAENADLRGKLDAALKHRFGRRSERQNVPAAAPKDRPGKATPHGRTALPDHLPRREVVHDLTEAEKLCSCCGRPRACIGEQTAEQLDLEPARFFVLRTIRAVHE